MKLREDFLLAASSVGANVSQLCREYGISRTNAYKWRKRFDTLGLEGLKDQSRRPKTTAGTRGETVIRIVELRRKYPDWGAKKLRILLDREGYVDAPCVKTIARILDRLEEPRVRKPRRRLYLVERQHEPLVVQAANDLWTVDFKGWWRTRDGKRFEPLTVRDAFSRFVLCLQMLESVKAEGVKAVFLKLFRRHGLPATIRVDNGAPFACTSAPGGLSRLSAWWTSLGIRVSFSRPAHPQDNGAHERMHADVAAELEADPADTLIVQQRAADRWRRQFNQVRPHEALAMRTPAEVYVRSPRRYRGVTLPSYPANHARRRVNRVGCIRHSGRSIFISSSLAGFEIAVRLKAGRLSVRFYGLRLGLFDLTSAPLHHAPRLTPLDEIPKSRARSAS